MPARRAQQHAPSYRETEIKLSVRSLAAARRKLGELGFRIVHRRVLEINSVLDTPAAKLRSRGCLLRLRTAGLRSIVTFKGPPEISKHRSRAEFEVAVDRADSAERIFSGLGFGPVFRYEKYRTELGQPNSGGMVMIDETPIGNFLELEGLPAWIDRTARALGYRESDYVTSSYGSLYLDWCKRQGVEPGHMVFPTRTTAISRGKKYR